jgi:hypothetical protein
MRSGLMRSGLMRSGLIDAPLPTKRPWWVDNEPL